MSIEQCLQSTDACYYWTTVESCIDKAVCNSSGGTPQCLVPYSSVTDVIAQNSNGNSEKKNVFKGNEFACNHNATIQSFEMYLDPAWTGLTGSDTAITFAIFERNGSTLTKMFEQQITVENMNVSAQYYSTGDISVNIENGKNYAIGAMWNEDCRYYYLNSVGQAVNFGTLTMGIGKENLSALPTSLDNHTGYSFRMNITSILR